MNEKLGRRGGKKYGGGRIGSGDKALQVAGKSRGDRAVSNVYS